ncbi:MAG: Glyoxalase/bleomycin resistance [Geobacteraceae bacterium]|nr:MAG: Glyoxalase/bleomycin resistance [Geobacteraceae bacterium]
MAEPRVSIQLTVAELLTTEAFYGGILELPVRRALTAPGAPEHLVMEQDGWELIFVEEAAVIRTHPVLEERLTTFPKGVGMTIHLRVEEIEDIYDTLVDEGLEILYPLEEKPYGMKELWCFDPDGYLVVLEETSR